MASLHQNITGLDVVGEMMMSYGVKTGFVGCMNNLDPSHYIILIIFIIL